MGMIRLDKNKIANSCDKIIEIFLYVLIFCLPFSKAIIEISATFIILAWIVKKTLKWQVVSSYLNIPIIIYILACFISVIFSSNFSLSLKNFCTKMMEYIILFFIVADFVNNRKRLKGICLMMLASAAMIGVDCIFQYYFRFDLLRFKHFQAERITGSFGMPGDLAGFLGPIFCLSLTISFLKLKKRIKYLFRIESILLFILLIILRVRGVWIGLFAAVCFLGLVENKKIIYIIITILLIFGAIIPQFTGGLDHILARAKTIFIFSDDANLDRIAIWQVAVRMIKDKPLFGHGFTTFMGNFIIYGKDYSFLKAGIVPYAHNCYLQMAAETGIVGLISFLTLIGTFFIYTIVSLTKIKDKFYHAVLSGISAGIIVTLAHSFVDTNLYSLQLSVLFWLMLGLNAALQKDFTFERIEG